MFKKKSKEVKEDICNFCGKKRSEVTVLISNPNNTSFICDSCIREAQDRIQDYKTIQVVNMVLANLEGK